METKKRRGSKVSLRAYPCSQAFALPPDKDKQRKACPRQVIYMHTIHLTLHSLLSIYTKVSTLRKEYSLIIYKGNYQAADIDIIYLPQTSLLHHRCIWFKVAKFDYTDSNVSKTSFRDWPYNWPEVSFHKINFVTHPHLGRLIWVQR